MTDESRYAIKEADQIGEVAQQRMLAVLAQDSGDVVVDSTNSAGDYGFATQNLIFESPRPYSGEDPEGMLQ
eukprot:gene10897-19555_t